MNRDPRIFIRQESNGEIGLISVYIDNFLLLSKSMTVLETSKSALSNKYRGKDLDQVKATIGW